MTESEIIAILRQHIKCDATGLSPAVSGVFLTGFEEAARALVGAWTPSGDGLDEARRLAAKGHMVWAIKEHRRVTGSGLKEAHDWALAQRDGSRPFADEGGRNRG